MKHFMTFFEMRSYFPFLFCLLSLPVLAQNVAKSPKSFGEKPILFTENRGQIADIQGIVQPDILFSAQGGGVSIFLNKTGISYQFTHAIYEEKCMDGEELGEKFEQREVLETQTYRFDMRLEGTNPNFVIRKEERSSYEENFYLAHCPQGITGVATYKRIVYENIYPHIDWVIYSTETGGMEYDFVVHPGGNPADIHISYTDVESLCLDEKGSLTLDTRLGKVVENKPYSYQGEKAIESHFQLADNHLSFTIAEYNKSQDLVIDPIIGWATYYGGILNDYGYACTTDASNNVYMTGMARSPSGIASGGFQNSMGGGEAAFLVKFNSSGNRLWATYYGGAAYEYDEGRSCAVDASGNVYMAGQMNTPGMASGGFQNTIGGSTDAFLVKFDASGLRIWATYYGGPSYEESGESCMIDASGNVYLAGYSNSSTAIASGGFQNTIGGGKDAFLVKFNSAGSRLWATYYGGTGADYGYSCALDAAGNIYMTGHTQSTSGIAAGGFQNTFYGNAAQYTQCFLVKFNSAGSRLWGTYYGGSNQEYAYSCATDIAGNVYMAGATYSNYYFATTGAHQTVFASMPDGFLVKFDGAGARLWATYYGGAGEDCVNSCVTDATGNVYIAGYTNSTAGIAYRGFKNTLGGNYDSFLAKFNPNGTRLWGTYYGGNNYDYGEECIVDASGNVYMAGYTGSSGMASCGLQNTVAGIYDAFLVKIKDTVTINLTISNITPCSSNAGITLTASGAGIANATSFAWKVNGYTAATTVNPTYTFPSFNYPSGSWLTCEAFGSGACTNSQAYSNAIVVTTDFPLLSTAHDTICTGGTTSFSISNNITSTYTWQTSTNGGSTWTDIVGYIGTNATSYTSSALSGNTLYRVISYNNTCGTQTSAPINITVISLPTITITGGVPICAYTSTTLSFSTTPLLLPYTYQWQNYDNSWTNYGGTGTTCNTGTVYGNTDFRVIAMNPYPHCTVYSNPYTVSVLPAPYITIYPQYPRILCAGGSIDITASGASSYSWTPSTGLSSNTGTTITATLNTSTAYGGVTVIGTDTNGCAGQRAFTIYVTPPMAETITVDPYPICAGNSATFTLDPFPYTYSYDNPTLQWKKNGVAIPGANNATYTTSTLANNDVIVCDIYTNQACYPIVSSNAITMPVQSGNFIAIPTIGITNPTACITYSPYTLSTTETFAGSNPTYQWKKNGINIIGGNSSTYAVPNPITNGDVYTCEMTSSAVCALNTPVVSQPYIAYTGAGPYLDVTGTLSSGEDIGCLGDTVTYSWVAGYCDNCGCYYQDYSPSYYNTIWDDYSSGCSYVVGQGDFSDITAYLDPCLFGASTCNSAVLYSGPSIPNSNGLVSSFTPTVSITSNNNNPCSGGIIIFSATSTYGGKSGIYQWKINGINVSGAIFKQVGFNNLQNGDIITCELTSSIACAVPSIAISNAITVSISGQSILSSLNPTICAGGAATITFSAGAGSSAYTWQQSTNGGASWYSVSGTNTSTTSILATLNATRLFRVIYTSACGIDTTTVFTLNVVPDPTVTVTANNNNFCAGTSTTTLTATLNGGVGTGIYQWQQYVGANWTNIAGATSMNYTTPILSTSTNYKVISSQTGLGCVTSGANTLNIVVKPLPSIYTSPVNPSFCTGGTSTITTYNGVSYSWSPGTGLNNPTGSPVIASPTTTTTYTLTGTGSNGCAKTISVPVTVNLDPSVSITGDTTVCSGGSLILTSVSGGGAGTCTRQWQSSVNGSTWTNISGATGTTYTTPVLTTTMYYRVTFSCGGSGCSPAATSATHKVHIFNNVLSVVGSTPLCVGGTVKLVAPVMGGTYICSWTWQSSPNNSTWTTIPNATLTFYYPPTNVAGSMYYRANVNCAGASCTNTPTASMLITVNPDPSVTISGQNSICGSGSTVLTANSLGGAGIPSYQWQENIAGVFTNIVGATAVSYTTAILTTTKTYRVSHTANGSGCGVANSPNYAISILTLPGIYTNPASPTICIGGTSTITAYNGISYSWNPGTGLNNTTGSPVIAMPTVTTAYTLTGLGANGCSKTISVPITVIADPTISISGPSSVPSGTTATLTSTIAGGTGTCTRQWQSSTNGNTWTNVSGATAATYTTPAITGTKYYRATYTCSGSGCSPAATSNVKAIIGIQPPVRLGEKVYDLTLYPNPASVNLTVSLSATEDEKAAFTITDMLGKTLTEWEGKPENGVYENEVSIENLSQGVYFLSVRIGERIMTEKFVKE